MPDAHFFTLASEAIAALNSPRFSLKLIQLVQACLDFDYAIILGCKEGRRPVYLYDSIDEERELLFQRYLTNDYQHDPFMRYLNTHKQQGIFTLKEVIHEDLDYYLYCQRFYQQTGWKDELCIFIEIEPTLWVSISIGFINETHFISKKGISALNSSFSIIESLCRQHWKKADFHLAEPVKGHKSSIELHSSVQDALATFGRDILTKREQQIAMLIAQGYDSKEIALKLAISEGTVKNHRKRIYQQFNIASLSEFFQLFYNHLVTPIK